MRGELETCRIVALVKAPDMTKASQKTWLSARLQLFSLRLFSDVVDGRNFKESSRQCHM
jgi:hypothetical protein